MPPLRPNDRRPEKLEHHVYLHGHSSDGVTEKLTQILSALGVLTTQGQTLMADITLAKEALATLNTTSNEMAAAVDEVIAADAAEDAAFLAEIQALKDQIAAGGAVTQADLDHLTAGMGGTTDTLKALTAALKAMGATPSDPIPPVDIPPVENPPA